jgi:hypothetical protein
LRGLEREHDGRAWLAWHIAGLQRVRRLPRLESLQHHRRRGGRQQPSGEFWGILHAAVIAAGGKVI